MQSLSVKYRPKSFDDMLAQDSIKTILRRQIETGNIKNCQLFAGTSGSGKTSAARIFANEINNNIGSPIEIDGASNNGVDNVREIIRSASERAVGSKYKVFIVDEAHALTNAAWQAFLKCIEEPPEFTVFIFCTTDPQKIPDTILNRVTRYNFTRVESESIRHRLEYICQCEGFTNYVDACDYISKIAQGSVRQAIALVDKAAGYSTDLSIGNVLNALGSFSYDVMFDLVNALIDGQEATTLQILNSIYNYGGDIKLFIEQFITFCLDIDKYAIFKSVATTTLPEVYIDKLNSATNFNNVTQYYSYVINRLLECKNSLKNDNNIKSTVEIYLLNICRCQ